MRKRYDGGHEPIEGGLCWHRWRNRQRVLVHCSWADGYRAALSDDASAIAALDLVISQAERRGGDLDAAWVEAEASLPDGDDLALRRIRYGATAGNWYAVAEHVNRPGAVSAEDRDPAVALRALAARLTSTPVPEDET